MRPNWQRMLSCAYTTQLLHSTGEVCWNNSDCYFIWLNLCEGSRENSFQEVLKAVLFGGWSISPTSHDWLICRSPIRVSTTFILSRHGKLLRDGCACVAHVTPGMRNVRRVHLTDI